MRENRDSIRRKVEYEVIMGYCEDVELYLFEKFLRKAKARMILSKNQICRIESDFQEYMKTARDIFDKVGGEFRQEMVYRALPHNKWVQLIKLIFSISVTKPNLVVKIPEEERRKFRKDIEKEIKRQNVH